MSTTNAQDYTTHHAVSPADQAVLAEVKAQSAAFKGTLSAPEDRASFAEMFEAIPGADGVSYERETLAGVDGVWCRVTGAPADAVIIHIHGGGYCLGGAWPYRHFAGQFAARTGVDVFIPDYPLAPEHPFPAAVDHVKPVYAALAGQGYARIALLGDSAGGGLSLVLTAEVMRDAALAPKPVGTVVISPWTDLTLSGAAYETRAEEEFYFTRQTLESFAQKYLAGHDPKDPAASPLLGDLAGLPPLQIHVGTAEILLSDSEDYAARAHAAGVAVEAHVWEAMPHVFPSSFPMLEGAESAMTMMAQFLRSKLAG